MSSVLDAGEHVVGFYAGDEELVAAVGSHLAEGLLAGEVAIAIATSSHRHALETALVEAGVDVAEAERHGRMVFLDAAETLALIVREDAVDPSALDAVVGGLVRRAAADGSRVRAYGEMVALLWEAGQVQLAIDLESMWNDLARRVPFSLYCTYPATAASADNGRRHAYEAVCRLHSRVVGDGRPDGAGEEREEQAFPASPQSSRAARRFVAAVLERWQRSELVDAAAYVVSELASNAVVHARSAFVVTVSRSGDGIRISVSDRSSAAPVLAGKSSSGLSGRGLLMVDAVARRWGVEPQDEGKSVWAELGSR